MKRQDVLQILEPVRGLTRREMVQGLAGAGLIALPGMLQGHPIQKHLMDAAFLDTTPSGSTDWKPEFMDAHQAELLSALAERMVPGSGKAQASRLVDLLLTLETAENQKSFKEALVGMDDEARKRFSGPFLSLTASQQDELLTSASDAPQEAPLHGDFENLKGWIVGAYYATEQGMRELGWTEESYFPPPAGCEHEDEHR